MNDNVLIALIIAVAAVVLIYILRDRLRGTKVEVNKEGVKVDLNTEERPITRISGNKIKGDGHKLTARNGGQIDQNEIDGNKTQIDSTNS